MLCVLVLYPMRVCDSAEEVNINWKCFVVREAKADDLAVERANIMLKLNSDGDGASDAKSGNNTFF